MKPAYFAPELQSQFDAWRGQRSERTNLGDAMEDECLEGLPGLVYPGDVYLHRDPERDSDWHLMLGRREDVATEAETLEPTLFAFAVVEGLFDIGEAGLKSLPFDGDAAIDFERWRADRRLVEDLATATPDTDLAGVAGYVYPHGLYIARDGDADLWWMELGIQSHSGALHEMEALLYQYVLDDAPAT